MPSRQTPSLTLAPSSLLQKFLLTSVASVRPPDKICWVHDGRADRVRDVSMLQWAMHGNVCSYEPNIDTIASMVQGKLMPRPPAILASLITITFIVVAQIPKNWVAHVTATTQGLGDL